MEKKNISTNTKDNFHISGLTINTGKKIHKFKVDQSRKTIHYNGKQYPYSGNPLKEAYKIIEKSLNMKNNEDFDWLLYVLSAIIILAFMILAAFFGWLISKNL